MYGMHGYLVIFPVRDPFVFNTKVGSQNEYHYSNVSGDCYLRLL